MVVAADSVIQLLLHMWLKAGMLEGKTLWIKDFCDRNVVIGLSSDCKIGEGW